MLTPFGYFDLIDEMGKTGCAVCNLLQRDAKKTLNTILYEYVTDPEMHQIFRASRGLCNEHGWQLTEIRNALSIAVLYRAVVDEVLKEIDRNIPDGKSPKRGMRQLFGKNQNAALVDGLSHHQPCPVCKKNAENEERYIMVLSDSLLDEKLMSAYRASDGLCLVHFRQVLDRTSDVEGSQALIEIQRTIWQQLRHELAEFARKYDHNNADEAMGDEADSWLRAVRQIGGDKGVFGLRDSSSK